MWIAHEVDGGGQHASNPGPQNVKLQPSESFRFRTGGGAAGTRFWPKMGCGAGGRSCKIGERGHGRGHCGSQGCPPGVDTMFEAIFGTMGGDLAFISLENGFTLPFTLEVKGDCQKGSATLPNHRIDCSGLSLQRCPVAEDLGPAGSRVDLRLWSSRDEAVGCYSPCAKLQHGGSSHKNLMHQYCCSTASPNDTCRAGSSDYVRAVHRMCLDADGYASETGLGPLRCQDTARYELTFHCPAHGMQLERGHELVEMLISKSSRGDAMVAWRRRCVWVLGVAGAIAAGAAAVLTVRGQTRWGRRRGRVLWQPLASPPGV